MTDIFTVRFEPRFAVHPFHDGILVKERPLVTRLWTWRNQFWIVVGSALRAVFDEDLHHRSLKRKLNSSQEAPARVTFHIVTETVVLADDQRPLEIAGS